MNSADSVTSRRMNKCFRWMNHRYDQVSLPNIINNHPIPHIIPQKTTMSISSNPNIYIFAIIWLILVSYFFWINNLPKILVPKSKINQNKKNIWILNKYIYLILCILIPTNIYIIYQKNFPNILLTVDSSLSMSALDIYPSRSEYIYSLLNKSITTLPNLFTLNSFDTNIHQFGKYMSSQETLSQVSKIKLWTGSALGDALIYDSLLLNHDHDILVIITDGSANIWFDHHQALTKIRKPIVLLAMYSTGYKIATDQNDQDIYIASDKIFVDKVLSDLNNTGIIISNSNQNLLQNSNLLKQILDYQNQKYQKNDYFYINWILVSIRMLQNMWFLYIYFRKK